MRDYFTITIKDLDSTVSRVNTGILVIDAFLNNYITMAESDSTIFKTNIQIDKSLITINEYDLCVILGNLLDNSYEACKKQSSPKDISVNIATERGNPCYLYNKFITAKQIQLLYQKRKPCSWLRFKEC